MVVEKWKMGELRNRIILDEPNICLDCGQEYERGIRSWAAHQDICQKNAPNESIESHSYHTKIEAMGKEENRKLNLLHPKLTAEETNRLMVLTFSGQIIGYNTQEPTVLMSSRAMERYNQFKNEMFKKYNIV